MKYKNEIAQMIHENAVDLFDAGLMDKKTMQQFDKNCLTPVKILSPEEIRNIREKENFSQAVFANYLNISAKLVSEWERGVKKPSGTALKLLTLVQNKGIEVIA